MEKERLELLQLQMFNNTNKTTDTTATTGNDLSVENKTFYNKTLIKLAEPNLVHDQFGDKYPIPKNGGKTIEFRQYDSLAKATTALSEGVTPNGTKLNVTEKHATVSQYGAYVELSDMLIMSAIDNNVVEALSAIGSQAGRTLDTLTRDVLASNASVIRAGARASRSALTTADTLKPIYFFQATAQLEAMNAPKFGDSYVAIIHPYSAFDLMTCTEWIDIHKYNDPQAIFQGEIGKIGNVRFVQSTEAKIFNDSTCPANGSGYYSVFSTLVLGKGAFGTTEITGGGLETIVKQLGSGDDPLNQRSSVGWKATKVAEILVPQYMVSIESLSSYSASATAN